jgi:hypothetical protein
MANMEVTDRSQYERADLSSAEGLRRGAGRGMAIYTVVAIVIAAALCYAAVDVIEGWAQWLVLAVIVLTAVGITIAINPARRQAG